MCITADETSAAQLRRAVAVQVEVNKPLLMPSVVSWNRLRAAAKANPHESEQRVIDIARVLPPSGERWQTTAVICANLPAALKANGGMRLADALSGLFEEMEECGVLDNPQPQPEGADFSFEAQLINNVREALNNNEHKTTMQNFARNLTKPLIFVCADSRKPTPAQQSFIDAANKAQVFCDEPTPEEQHLRAALSAEGENLKPLSLRERGRGEGSITCKHCRQSPAASLADAANIALDIVRSFLTTRKDGEKIGIVVYDRLLARRLRALAENANILIADSAGWRAATLSCGAALMEAAQAMASPFDADEAETLLQPPFWRALTNDEHEKMQSQWRETIDNAPRLPESWREVGDLCESESELNNAARQLQNNDGDQTTHTAGEWLSLLREKFAPLLECYDEDAAAQEMFARITACGGMGEMRAAEFCAWLRLFLRGEYFAGDDIDSPAVFLPPTSAAEGYAEVLLLGANDETLPNTGGGAFGEKTRAAFGLPSRREEAAKQRDDFCRLIAARETLCAVWCARKNNGEPLAPSPFWQLFADEVKNNNGEVSDIGKPPPNENENIAAGITPPVRAEVLLRELPEKARVTDAKTLMQCPYQFFARAVLQLRDGETETELSPLLEGEILHEALQQWAATDGSEEEWHKALQKSAAKKRRPRQSLEEHCWLQNSAPLLQWEKQRREDGWKLDACEKALEVFVPLTSGAGVKLRGRIDRLDKRDDETALIDYKRRASSVSQKSFQCGEDPQLPLYAFLSNCPGAQLIIRQPIKTDNKDDKPLHANVRRIAARLRAAAKQAARGKPLPANGATETCQKCEARRLCRKDHWE